ncbi:tRNA glutamyl-Q(34) synthetase GluQRS [Chelativorans sp. Marseille-P2723]|uniref:tRNA glutamyl-Q(34) synthetase GluQRS n=1 Tax=Chelativorans sp. Marseille-P2723 TaxID=2709133 RepID=UPI00156E65DD|nr:tRNA glutamyl-Q(34) synthetase GluQRS [Chelativorans sp. Marseille-P2723]
MTVPVLRFAPSSNGPLHLGHAYSALLNFSMAQAEEGRFLLRIEDIDIARCSRYLEEGIYRDLSWLGIEWEEPVRRQSEHFDDYAEALQNLIDAEIVYPSFMTRGEVRAYISDCEAKGVPWPRDPEDAPLFPPVDRQRSTAERRRRMAEGEPFAWRIDMAAACSHAGRNLAWEESGSGSKGETGLVIAQPELWGDVVIARRDLPASYHLAVVVDDALQGITHVVRGRDLFQVTAVHRLLQELLGLPVPRYHHHALILDASGRKLSKSQGDTSIAALRAAGAEPRDIARMVGLGIP